MNLIVSSTIKSVSPQAEGTRSVIESHIYESGSEQEITYIAAADLDIDAVLAQRAANINAELTRRYNVELEANNFEAPITVRDFLDLLGEPKRKFLLNLAKSNDDIADALNYLNAETLVFKYKTIPFLAKLKAAGLLTEAEVTAILAGFN